jgi:hypothetical protein
MNVQNLFKMKYCFTFQCVIDQHIFSHRNSQCCLGVTPSKNRFCATFVTFLRTNVTQNRRCISAVQSDAKPAGYVLIYDIIIWGPSDLMLTWVFPNNEYPAYIRDVVITYPYFLSMWEKRLRNAVRKNNLETEFKERVGTALLDARKGFRDSARVSIAAAKQRRLCLLQNSCSRLR